MKPTQSSISESDKAEMEEYIDNIKLLVNTLGHKVFEEKREMIFKEKPISFFIKAARGADAEGAPVSEEFVVFKHSKAALNEVESIPKAFHSIRESFIEKGVLIEEEGSLIFQEDTVFTIPSTAASIVMARNANGLQEWKTQDNTTLKEYESTDKMFHLRPHPNCLRRLRIFAERYVKLPM